MQENSRTYRLPLLSAPGQVEVQEVINGNVFIDMTSHNKQSDKVDAEIKRITQTYCSHDESLPTWPFMGYIHLNKGTWHGYTNTFKEFKVALMKEIPRI